MERILGAERTRETESCCYVFLLVVLVVGATCLCCSLISQGSGVAGPFWRDLPGRSGLAGWTLEAPAEYADDLEGLTKLIDGAADLYWQKGVRQVLFQSFVRRETRDTMELQWFCLRTAEEARDFFMESCLPCKPSPPVGAKNGECAQDLGATSASCLLKGTILLKVSLERPLKEGFPLFQALSQGFENTHEQ